MFYILAFILAFYIIIGIACSLIAYGGVVLKGFSASGFQFFLGILNVICVWPYYVIDIKKGERK